MPATADAQGRVKCKACGATLWFLERDAEGIPWLKWNDRRRPGAVRTFRVQADHPGLEALSIDCECGARWSSTPFSHGTIAIAVAPAVPLPTPALADSLRKFAATAA